MNDGDIYALTRLGELQLRGAQTTASPDEVNLLVRIDGALSVGQLKEGMNAVDAVAFDTTLGFLLRQGLLQPSAKDPFGDQFNFVPSSKLLAQATQEADAAEVSLKRSGYFVRIARRNAAAAAKNHSADLSALVVEDSPQLAKFLQHYLAFEGFEARIASDRTSILQALGKSPVPDLVLLDVELPDVNGFKVLTYIRSHPRLRSVPVIMLTARATREAVIKGLAAGADGYVTKPFEVDALLETVRTVLALPPSGTDSARTTGRPL